MNWSRRFADPIPRPDGRPINTLAQARHFLLTQRDGPQAQTAAGQLLRAAEHGDPFIMFARTALLRLIHGERPPPIGNPHNAPKQTHWGKRRLKRDS